MACKCIFTLFKELLCKQAHGVRVFRLTNVTNRHSNGGRSAGWCSMSRLDTAWQRFLFGSRWQSAVEQIRFKVEVLSELFTKQCSAIAAQRVRRTGQILDLYCQLYNRQTAQRAVERLGHHWKQKRNQPLGILLGAALFAWEKENITDEEMIECANEMYQVRQAKHLPKPLPRDHLLSSWESLIDKNHLHVWRKPVPDSYLYEYKVYGTYRDIPARAFFNVQVDLEYRKQWDKLVIKLEVIDRDAKSGSEVVQWITHFPYPMYSREYVYLRKCVIDEKKNVMVLLNRSTQHPACPVNRKYVRVNTLHSQMVIKPHKSFDENGFDYVLTYCDDPQAPLPSVAYNWMASTGVPDFVNKIHNAAKLLHEKKLSPRQQGEEECGNQEQNRVPM